MERFEIPTKNKQTILALGAESAGNFSVFKNGVVYFSEDFGDLLDEENFKNFKFTVLKFLKEQKIKPSIILSDLHPFFHTTMLAQELAKKYKAKHVPVQHHLAHVFSAIGDRMIHDSKFVIHDSFLGVACDGTGFGFDEKIWGGEIFELRITNHELGIMRIGHLENQIMIGGELAIREPARVLFAVLSKFLSKEKVHKHTKKYYSKNEFELLWNQLDQNFNCLKTSSTARILDAISVLLGFSKNESLIKHGPVALLEENSTVAYNDLKPRVVKTTHESGIMNYELCTTHLFEYLIKNLNKDEKRLAATAQKYIADGLLEIVKLCHSRVGGNPELSLTCARGWIPDQVQNDNVYFAGGMANNKIISEILKKKGVYINKKIPRGDAGISFGQIFYYICK